MRRNGNNTRRVDIDRASPVESRRDERASIRTDATVPTIQSVIVALAFVLLVDSVFWFIIIIEPVTFIGGVAVVGVLAVLWMLLSAERMTPFLLVVAFTITGMGGVVTWSLLDVATFIFADRLRVAVFSLVLFSASLWFHLETTLLQRLAQPWQFQRMYFWKGLMSFLEWKWKREPPRNNRQPMVKTGRPTIPSVDPEPYQAPPESERTEIELFLMLAQEWKTLARDDSKGGDGLRGKLKANGQKMTKSEWQDGVAWLREHGYLVDGKNEWKQGASASVALGQFSYE